jgi:predicted RNA-binding protein YlxR (DUF448 family)
VPSTIPQRTCIACKRKGDQFSFLRISSRLLAVLIQGASQGRSAYVCPSTGCVDAAFTKGRLSRALRQALDGVQIERLRRDLASSIQVEKHA